MSSAAASPAMSFPVLEADGRTLSVSSHRMGWLQPIPADTALEDVRTAFRRDGYVWLKGFLDRETVLDFRERALDYLAPSGLLAAEVTPRIGKSGAGPVDDVLGRKLLMELVRTAAFESFCMPERLWQFMDRFLGGPSYLHKRKMLRHTRPNAPGSTPAHYDLTYLRGGTDRIVTAWIPIGDIPAEMGGLVYLEGSHQRGVELERDFSAQNATLSPEERISAYNRNMTEGGWVSKDLPDMAERFDTCWLIADYEAGDIVLHSPYMIHAATLNRDRDHRIRLSADIRYQNVRDEVDARWNNHWSLDDML